MGLRIGTNIGALTAIRNLQTNSLTEAQVLERLSTGKAINRASDNPSGLVILQQLRAQLTSIDQSVNNTQNAANLVDTADAALGQIADQLSTLRGNFIAGLNTGALGPDAQNALQDTINASVAGIDRIGQTTRFGDINLLNGNLGFNISSASPALTQIDVQGGMFPAGFPVNVNVNVLAAATPAQATGTIAPVQAGNSTVSIRGPLGEQQLQFTAGETQSQVISAINGVTNFTGVQATAGGQIQTTQVGSQASVNIQNVSGTFSGITPGISFGTNIVAQVNGLNAPGSGNQINVQTQALSASISVQPGTTGSFNFTIAGGGANFQIGPLPNGPDNVTLGIGAQTAATIGQSSGIGSLNTLITGGANSLAVNPSGGSSVVSSGINEISSLRSRLGSISSQVFQTNIDSLNVAFGSISQSASTIGDTSFAEEIARATRAALLRQSGLATLKSANLNAGLALRLLG